MSDPNLRRRFLRLAALNVAANLTVPLAALVDTGMLGHLEHLAPLGGVALATVLFDYVYWSFGFLRMGTTGLAAQALGTENPAEVWRVLYRGLALAMALAGGVLLLQWPLRELGLALLSGAPDVETSARAYFDARIWGAPATLANFALLGWFLGREQSGRALVMTLVANVANIALDAWLILDLGLGAWGAGAATAASQYLMLAVGCFFLARSPDREPWRWSDIAGREALLRLLRLNVDILIRTFCLVSCFGLFTDISSALGTEVLAANAILLRLFSLVAYLVDGVAFASESLAGIFAGARDALSLDRLLRLAMVSGLGIAAISLAALSVFPRQIYGSLTSHDDLLALAVDLGPWLAPVLAFGAAAFVLDGLFLGLTAGRELRNAMLVSTVLVFLPLAGLAAWRADTQLLWAAMATFMLARTATLASRWGRARRVAMA